MATLRKYGGKYNSTFCQLCGLSTDTKPTSVLINDRSVGLADGSEFIEMDTNKKYKYSADNATWYEVESGGGGGSSATLIDKTITANGTYNATDDGANGYKSVDVEVAPSNVVASGMGYYDDIVVVLNSSTGYYVYEVPDSLPYGSTVVLCTVTPVKHFSIYGSSTASDARITFYINCAFDANFDGIDTFGWDASVRGTYTKGDGNLYRLGFGYSSPNTYWFDVLGTSISFPSYVYISTQ